MTSDEFDAIGVEAANHGVDADLMRAIRIAENGWGDEAVGAYMGVRPENPPATRAEALQVACASVRDILASSPTTWSIVPGVVYQNSERYQRLALSPATLAYLDSRWAPAGAANDPHNKNANWLRDVTAAYSYFAMREN